MDLKSVTGKQERQWNSKVLLANKKDNGSQKCYCQTRKTMDLKSVTGKQERQWISSVTGKQERQHLYWLGHSALLCKPVCVAVIHLPLN